MKKNRATLFVLIILLLIMQPLYASNIVGIALAQNIPFLLDDEGQVWAFRKPQSFEEPIKLPNLNHIKKIEPYIAIDTNGQVYTWRLDVAKTDTGPNGIIEAAYTSPQRVEGLQGVTKVASLEWYYFAAVIADKEIVDWVVMPDKLPLGMHYGPVRNVISRKGVKALSVYWSPEVISISNVAITPSVSSLMALFDDGAVMGWGIKPTGVTTEGADRKGILLTHSPGANGVAINAMHTVILTKNGVPQFWGGCEGYKYRKDLNGQPVQSGVMGGVDGYINDVIGMDLFSGYDNIKPDVFIKRDGSVWAALAPAPLGKLGKDCYLVAGKNMGQFWQLTAGKAAAVQARAGDSILMLDADHKLWTTAGSWMNMKFHNVPINLK